MLVGTIGAAEVILVLGVAIILAAAFVGLVALGVRIGTRDLRKRT